MLDVITLRGDAYAIGFAAGRHAAPFVRRRLIHAPAWRRLARWHDSTRLAMLEQCARRAFPRYVREIEGMAEGAGLGFAETLLWNCRGDIDEKSGEGCTTVIVPDDGGCLIGHNEDGDPDLREGCALAEVVPDEGVRFFSFLYPLSLPGNSFSVTGRGLVQTINNLRAEREATGVPRQFVARAVIDAHDLDGALDVLRTHARASGYHHMLAQSGDRRSFSVEAPAGGLSVLEVSTPTGHTNHILARSLAHLRQRITASSAARQARIEAWCAGTGRPRQPEEIRRLLADRDDPVHPVWRNDPADPDNERTIASAVFEIEPAGVRLSVFASRTGDPFVSFRWPVAEGQETDT